VRQIRLGKSSKKSADNNLEPKQPIENFDSAFILRFPVQLAAGRIQESLRVIHDQRSYTQHTTSNMAQGASKGAKGGKTKSIGATKRKAGHMRKGKMEIAPKSAQHIQEKRQKKVRQCSSTSLSIPSCIAGLNEKRSEEVEWS
jgi:hypothetical protein